MVNLVDTAAPVITLTGSATVTHALGITYTDAGATASDTVDGVVSVTSAGTVNVNAVGTYTITYSATDTAGNAATQVTRTVSATSDDYTLSTTCAEINTIEVHWVIII